MKVFRLPRLFKLFFVALLLLGLARVMAHADPAADLAAGLAAERKGDVATGLSLAGKPGSVTRDLVWWEALRDGKGTFDDYRGFIARRPDWPGLPYLMRKGEAVIPAGYDAGAVVAWFNAQPAQTGTGALAAIDAYMRLGRTGDAEAEAVRAWRSLSFEPGDDDRLLQQFPKLLAKHHTARLDMLLWEGRFTEAQRLMPRVSEDWQKLATARIALRRNQDGVDGLLAQVPKALADDPGLAWDRYQWRKKRGLDSAVTLMDERSASAASLGRPDVWARDRRWAARDLMRDGKAKAAYRLASRHRLSSGSDFADLEWLSGYIALRYLKDPKLAHDHFVRFRQAVDTPISLGRAGYWEGRSLEAMGKPVDALAAYEFGAEFQTSFYGLLAAERAALPMDPALMGQERYPDWRKAAFLKSSVLQAAQLLQKAGERDLAERFMRHLCESLDATQMGQLADMALDLHEPHIALSIAKFAADQGIVLNRPYYPVTSLAKMKLPVPVELALSIARRESEFDPVVISHAGARGLMQLMPATAKAMAAEIGEAYAQSRLTSDPDYNARLGSRYLAKMINRFGDNPMLVAAAYNAGPSRPDRWIRDYGDPRDPNIDPVDWIETIPFDETRNYIMRVTESLPVYRARLHGKTEPIRLTDELKQR